MSFKEATENEVGNPSITEWRSGRILVLGMTYPHYSATYTENACTGGILEETGQLVRVHPLPHRYLAERPKTFQWMHVQHKKHDTDPRPESLHIEPNSIHCGDVIASDDVDDRRRWLTQCAGLMPSVEEVHRAYARDKTSMAIVRPAEILRVRFVRRSETDRQEWVAKESQLLAQTRIAAFIGNVKPIDFPDTRFMVSWRCDSRDCETHEMGIEEWGLHELWRKLADEPDREEKVRKEIMRRLDLDDREVFFYLGNFRTTMWNFGLMGMCSLKRKSQLSLFG